MTENENNVDGVRSALLEEEDMSREFYTGAGRGETVRTMREALEQGVPLLVLTGEEGSGKTMVCRVLEREASRTAYTVFLPRTVESFEDVVKKVTKQLGIVNDGAGEGRGLDRTLERLAAFLKRESTALLIFFDEAENLYLATLERIRKMVDRLTEAGARVHVVFSGRESFLDNYDQLSICRFAVSSQLQFSLLPLSEDETGEYLRSLGPVTEQTSQRVFNDEMVRKIHALAAGNFGRIRLLAEESLRTQGDDTSFMVLLGNVKDETPDERGRGIAPRLRVPVLPARYLPWLGGLACILALLFFLARSDSGDRQREPAVPAGTNSAKTEAAPVAEQRVPEVPTPQENALPAPHADSATLRGAPDVPPETGEEREAAAPGSPESLDDGPVAVARTEEAGPPQSPAAREKAVEVIHVAPIKKKNPVPPQNIVASVSSVPEERPRIRVEKPVKIKKDPVQDMSGKPAITLRPPAIKEHLTARDSIPAEQLLQRRINAGDVWSRKARKESYTMQLMVLTDKNAEDNLRKMLSQPRYRQESDNFYIFRKASGSPIVFVFYGEYPNLAMAREAQNRLPPFLQNHQPYAISVQSALAKVKR